MSEPNQLPELYTQREVDKTRKRQRMLGRFEGAAAIVAAGAIFNFVGSIPTLLVLGVVGYVLYKILAKPKPDKGGTGLDS